MKQLTRALMLGLAGLIACSTNGQNKEKQSGTFIYLDATVETFEKGINDHDDEVILDVRTPEEVAQGMIPNAQHLDIWGDDFEAGLNQLDKTNPVFVYCKSGGRSSKAMNKMKELGFSKVYNLQGGYTAWVAAGKPTTK